MVYIDTSVLLVYTLTQVIEKHRYPFTERFFAKILDGSVSAATSFYSLHELYVFALDNAPDFSHGAAFGKAALEKILAVPLQILPFEETNFLTRIAGNRLACVDARIPEW